MDVVRHEVERDLATRAVTQATAPPIFARSRNWRRPRGHRHWSRGRCRRRWRRSAARKPVLRMPLQDMAGALAAGHARPGLRVSRIVEADHQKAAPGRVATAFGSVSRAASRSPSSATVVARRGRRWRTSRWPCGPRGSPHTGCACLCAPAAGPDHRGTCVAGPAARCSRQVRVERCGRSRDQSGKRRSPLARESIRYRCAAAPTFMPLAISQRRTPGHAPGPRSPRAHRHNSGHRSPHTGPELPEWRGGAACARAAQAHSSAARKAPGEFLAHSGRFGLFESVKSGVPDGHMGPPFFGQPDSQRLRRIDGNSIGKERQGGRAC